MYTFMLSCHSLTLKEQSKIKSDTTKRFAASDFLKVNFANLWEPIISEIEALLKVQTLVAAAIPIEAQP